MSHVFLQARNTPQRQDCLAGVGGLELRNVDTNYLFERSHRFAGNPAEFWLWRLFAFELRRWGYAARAWAAGMLARATPAELARIPRVRAEFRPWRPLAFELQRRDTQLGLGSAGIFSKRLHGRWPSCGVALIIM